jgi:hypothetical protein
MGVHSRFFRVERPVKIVVILFLVAIFASLGSALFTLYRDQSGSTRTVKALTIRISLSIGLFLLLMASYYFGWFTQKL